MKLHELRDALDYRELCEQADRPGWRWELTAYVVAGVAIVLLLLCGCALRQEYSVSWEQKTRDGETVKLAWKGEVERR